jgi:predicted TIM-barrel fold metal-dependent hydrolase
MKAIDVHTHAFPDALADRAIEKLEGECPWKAVGDGKVATLIDSMDAAGVDVSVACAIATKPEQAAGILKWCGQIRSDRIVPFPSFHPDTPQVGRWVERAAAGGYRGLKLHPMYQQFAIDEPRLDELYAAAEACGLMIAFHCGRDIAFPMDDDRAEPVRLARVLDRFPKLEVIATHMGGWKMWDESDALLVGRQVYFETSFSLANLGPQRIVDMIRRHGIERVLFGSDWPWARQDTDLAGLAELDLTADELGSILHGNAERLLGPQPGR